ncbi:MAG: hypothetical protein ACLFR0_04440 [Alphaproteobacteria bacterium]
MADEDIQERLKNACGECLKSYEAWRGDEKNEKTREAMQDAIHELRKVSSRLEIELAISEREQMTQKPIPIPPHRASKAGKGQPHDDGGDHAHDQSQGNKVNVQRKPQRRRSPKKAAGGND